MTVLAVVAAAGLFLSTRSALSLSALRTGQEALQAGVFDLAQISFERAYTLDPLDPHVLTLQADLDLRAFRSTSQAAWLDKAERSLLQSVDLSPNYYYNYLMLASIYNSRGDRARADAAIAKARAVSPYETERDIQASFRKK